MTILFEPAPTGTTHFIRFASGHVVWCKMEQGDNNQPILKEWDGFNKYWVPGIHTVEHYQSAGLTSIDDFPTNPESPVPESAPLGATHCYHHGGEVSWYRETDNNLFVWRDGSWYASVYKTALELSKACPLGAVSSLGQKKKPEQAEDDLTWLARYVPRWLSGMGASHIATDTPAGYVFGFFKDAAQPSAARKWFSKDQWLARRAELQNKPSWKDAPEWATHLGQNMLGLWTFTEFRPEPNDAGGWSMSVDDGLRHCTNLRDGQEGEVLGDWRDTLEKRPGAEADITDQFDPEFRPVTVTNETVPLEQPGVVAGTGSGTGADKPDFEEYLRWYNKKYGVTESAFLVGRVIDLLRTSADHFSADELADLNELTDAELTKRDAAVCGGHKYIDAHWFERGELPPVGTVCEVLWNEGRMEYLRTKVFGVNEHGQPIHRFDEGPKKFEYQADPLVTVLGTRVFRPIRTERDVLIDVLKGTHAASLTNLDMLASAILAAGFKRDGGAA